MLQRWVSMARHALGRCILCGRKSHPARPGWPNPCSLCATCLLYTVEEQLETGALVYAPDPVT
jgi:hypothetical protein